MKFKTTKKAIKENYNTILNVGYCNLQTLLKFEEATAYSTRSEGWACDYYDIDGIIICTGYSCIGKVIDTDITKRYEYLASSIIGDGGYYSEESYNVKKSDMHKLILQFIEEVK